MDRRIPLIVVVALAAALSLSVVYAGSNTETYQGIEVTGSDCEDRSVLDVSQSPTGERVDLSYVATYDVDSTAADLEARFVDRASGYELHVDAVSAGEESGCDGRLRYRANFSFPNDEFVLRVIHGDRISKTIVSGDGAGAGSVVYGSSQNTTGTATPT